MIEGRGTGDPGRDPWHERRMIRTPLLLALLLSATAADAEPYGQIGRMLAKPGRRDALAALVSGGCRGMPGCRAYLVAADAGNPDALWITEEWDSKAAHDASLALPRVRSLIARGRPLIAGMDSDVVTVPLGRR